MTHHRINEEKSEISDPQQRTPSVFPVLQDRAERPQLEEPCPGRVMVELSRINDGHFFYFRPSSQFLPVLSIGRAVCHTKTAAGISNTSHFSPPNSATSPKKIRTIVIRTIVQFIDFFEFALMCRNLLKCQSFRVTKFQNRRSSESRDFSVYFETSKPWNFGTLLYPYIFP